MASQIVLPEFHIFFFKNWVLLVSFFGTVEHLPHLICVNVKLSIFVSQILHIFYILPFLPFILLKT